jgi:hypothetical protein
MAMHHSPYNENPNPTAEYRALWQVLNKRMISIKNEGFIISSALLTAMMLDNEEYLRKERNRKGLSRVLTELELRGTTGLPDKVLRRKESSNQISEHSDV